jgi:putative ABC transport system permease protein
VPRHQEINIDFKVLGFVVGASILSALLLGILPALQGSIVDSNLAMKSNSRGAGHAARFNRWRNALVVSQVSLCFVLLMATGLLIQSFAQVQSVLLGFDSSKTLAVRLSLPRQRYANHSALEQFNEKLYNRLKVLPGVEDVGAVSILPMGGGGNTIEFGVVGQTATKHDSYSANYRVSSADYFRTMKIPLMQGRIFSNQDRQDKIPVALINQTMSRKLWPNGNAVASHIQVDDNNSGPRRLEIVGVVGDVKQLSLESDPAFDIYIPINQVHQDNIGSLTNGYFWVVRSRNSVPAIESNFLRSLQEIDREVATSNIKPLEDFVAESVAPRKFNLRLLTIFSVAALCLALMGIYGVVSHTVSQRTPEIGIRLALGARPTQVFRLILAQGAKLILVGLALGVIGAFAITRLIRGLLFNVSPGDPFTFLFVATVLFAVALIASGIPARRATKVDPVVALRND